MELWAIAKVLFFKHLFTVPRLFEFMICNAYNVKLGIFMMAVMTHYPWTEVKPLFPDNSSIVRCIAFLSRTFRQDSEKGKVIADSSFAAFDWRGGNPFAISLFLGISAFDEYLSIIRYPVGNFVRKAIRERIVNEKTVIEIELSVVYCFMEWRLGSLGSFRLFTAKTRNRWTSKNLSSILTTALLSIENCWPWTIGE